MSPRHRLLTRQLARHLGASDPDAPALRALLADVSRAYEQSDADRLLLERSLELTSQELLARNAELSTAMRHAAISFWAWDPVAQELSIQGVGPVGFAEVHGRASFGLAAVLERVHPRDHAPVAAELARRSGQLDLVFQVVDGASHRWVRMRGHRERTSERFLGVWADVTDETEAALGDRRRRLVMERQNRTLQRLAERLVDGTGLLAALPQVCAELCETLDVARASVWLHEGEILRCATRYDRALGQTIAGASVAVADLPRFVAAVTRARTFAVSEVAAHPDTVEIAHRAAELGTVAILDSACRIGGQVVGMVCYEHAGAPREWTPEERSFAASVADGISLAIEGQRLQRAERERAELEDSLRQAQKMESLGMLAGGVAHDFNNLLTPILICGEMVRDAVAHDPDLAESVDAIVSAGNSARDLVAQLLAFGRKQMLQLQPVDVGDVCERAIRLLAHTLPATIRLELALAPGLAPVLADAVQLQQVIVNLAINARDAMADGGTLTLGAHEIIDGDRRFLTVVVADTGHGIDAQTLPHIFDPFFTTKGVGRGTGLGLSTVYGIIKQHCGTIDVHSEVGRGTRFEIRLPISIRPALAAAAPSVGARAQRAASASTILVVEDDPAVLSLVTRVLRREGYRVLEADGPTAAIDLASHHEGWLDLVLTDVVMPSLNGVQMFGIIARTRPGLRVMYMSGYDQEAIASETEAVALLRKPFSVAGLVAAVQGALAAPRPPARMAAPVVVERRRRLS